MAKITEYSKKTAFENNDLLLTDGVSGTKTITVENAAKDFLTRSGQKTINDTVSSDIETLKTNSATKADVNKMKSDLTNSINDHISTSDTKFQTITSDVSKLKTDSANKTDLQDLKKKVDGEVSDHIKSSNSRFDALEASKTTLTNRVNAIQTEVSEATDSAASAIEKANDINSQMENITSTLSTKVDDVEVIDGYLYLLSNGEQIAGPYGPFSGGGGGGGGTEGNNAVLSVMNTSGWSSKTIAQGNECIFNLTWSSVENEIPTGNGTLKVMVNGVNAGTLDIPQGSVEVNLTPYLNVGTNSIRLQTSDVYGNGKTLVLTVKMVAVSISSTFDNSGAFNDSIPFTYVPTGSLTKNVVFLLDGVLIGTQTVSTSGRQQTYYIPQQSHGSHSLEAYFTAEMDGQTIESNHLYFDLICITPGNYTPIVAIDFNQKTVDQYSSLVIPYSVYDPNGLETEITLKVNGNIVNTLTVDRSRHQWTYRANSAGVLVLAIQCGDIVKTVSMTVKETDIDAKAETNDLALYLSSYGRSNAEANPGTWKSGDISAVFNGFNFTSDGWQTDEDGITVLRVSGDARLTIPYNVFGSDFRTTGKTIEVEFATRDVRDYDAKILSCMSGGRGIELTAQLAKLKSEQSEIFMQYKDGEHLRISFVIEKRSKQRLIYCYVDGIISGVIRYPSDDDFAQNSPVGISIGSSECATDIYCIRVYDNDLTKEQMLNNWIADTQNGPLMLERYGHNSVYDEYGNIVIDALPKDLPYLILEAPELPQYKGDKKTVSGQYVDPLNSSRSFTFSGAQIDVQGTSSQYYARKNYKLKFKNGLNTSSGKQDKYSLRPGDVAVDAFCFKADVASSEGCNNVELAILYNDACPYKTPPQKENPRVRQGIDGFPMVIFWNDGDNTSFLGKYNFNNDKGTEDVFGFKAGDESWETKNNTSNRVLFKDDNFTGTSWTGDYEARYPEDNMDVSKLSAFSSWVKSTDGNLSKFKSEINTWCDLDSALFYWLFTELFLMVDSRAKNSFPTRYNSEGKWVWLPYDFDTALGINNEGVLAFGYSLEDTDHLDGGADVFNGQESVFWKNIRDGFKTEIATMYQNLRSTGAISYDKVLQMFNNHQAKWPEAVFNEDSQYKYLDPLIESGDAGYLSMLQGSKKSQRDWWLYNRMRYMDSKYNAGDDRTDTITLRGYAKSNVTVTPYADIYCNIKYGSYLVSTRGKRNQQYTLECPLSNVNDTEIYIYSASRLASVGDLSGLKVGYAEFSNATKLQSLKLGDSSSSYSNANLTELHLGNNTLLKTIDCRNCVNLGTGSMATVDVSGCSNIEEIYMEGTKITGIGLPNGGQLRKLHLPNTVSNLTIRNQKKLTDLSMPSFAGISTLRIENSSVDALTIMNQIAANSRVRIIGFELDMTSADKVLQFYDKLDTFRGLDENGNNTDKPQMSGSIHIPTATGAQLKEMKERYPGIKINADHFTCTVKYYTWDGATLLHTETVQDGGDATYSGTPSRSSTAQYTYTFDGWSSTPGGTLWANAKKAVTEDRNVYAHFTATVRKYTVYFYNGSTLLQTVQNVPYGSSASYTGSTPVDPSGNAQPFQGWNPSPTNIQGNTSCYAQYSPMYTCTFKNGDTVLYTVKVQKGSTAVYSGATPTDSSGNNKPFIGWDKGLTNIQADTTFNAVFFDFEETITDSWETIISNINAASTGAACGYSVGATKVLDFGGDFGQVAMQLVAVDMDNLASGGKAKTTWLAKQIGTTSKRMNPAFAKNSQTVTKNSWLLDTTNNWYKTNTQNMSSSTAKITFVVTPSETGTLKIGYKVGSEANYDELTIKVDGTAVVSGKSGNIDWTDHEVEVTSGTAITVEATYTKDGSGDQNGDTCYIKFSGAAHTLQTTVTSVTESVDASIKNGTGAIGGWQDSEMRTYVKGLKANLPAAVKNAIKDVTKTTQAFRANTDDPRTSESYTQTTTDDLWIPCYNEICHSSSAVKYAGFFTNDASRKKYKVGATSSYGWWLRYASSETGFRYINDSGSNIYYTIASNTRGVVPGFCI